MCGMIVFVDEFNYSIERSECCSTSIEDLSEFECYHLVVCQQWYVKFYSNIICLEHASKKGGVVFLSFLFLILLGRSWR